MTKLFTFALFALAACSSTPSTHLTPCHYDSTRFGERTARFSHAVANLPSYVADHVSNRMWRMGNTVDVHLAEAGRNANETAYNFGPGFWSLMKEEGGRVQSINNFLDRHAAEERQNAHCFFEKAWFHLQLLE